MRCLRRFFSLLLVGTLLLVLSGCAEPVNKADVSEKTQTTPQQAAAAPEPAESTDAAPSESESEQAESEVVPEPKPIVIKGKGTRVSKKFKLTEGLAVFTMSHSGRHNFIVDLRSTDGEVDENLVNEIGKFKGSWPLFLGEGTYLLKVDADGPWSFTITQPRPTEVPEITTFKGKGKTATKLFYLEQGMRTVYLKHKGEHNFIVDIMGAAEENLVNEIGDFDGSTILDVPESGGAIISVEADGSWSIRIE